MGKRCSLPPLLSLAVLIAGILAGCGGAGREEATPTPMPTAAVPSKPIYKVERGLVVEELKFTGRIAPVQEEQLFFRTDGRVAMVAVEQGAKVKKGDLLAELEVSDLQNQLAQAQLNLDAAELRLKNAEQSSAEQRTQLEIALETARLRLAQAKVKDPAPSVTIAAANRDKAAAAVQAAQAAYDVRAQRPGAAGSPEAASLQRATLDYEIAKAQYELALQNQKAWEYDLQILEQAVRAAELNLQKVLVPTDPLLAQEVAKARLVVERLQAQAANARLVAPFDGEVTMVAAYAGRTINAYRPAIGVAAPGALEISADLMSDAMARLSIGQECTITLVNYPGREFHGRIRRLPYPYGTGGSTSAAITEEDRSTRISIDDADVTLEKGALVRVAVTLQRKENALWLPPGAIRTFSGKDFVLVLDGEGQRRVPVKLGIRGEDQVEIESGVTEGQVVIGP
mgnify:CR=1 FL=1